MPLALVDVGGRLALLADLLFLGGVVMNWTRRGAGARNTAASSAAEFPLGTKKVVCVGGRKLARSEPLRSSHSEFATGLGSEKLPLHCA